VVADVTIHPILELKVGSYAEHKMGHRTCEMHQDAYIFQRLNLGDVGLSEHLVPLFARNTKKLRESAESDRHSGKRMGCLKEF